MLESLRTIQNTRVGKAILTTIMGLILVSFVIWGIGPVFNGFNANQIASVGGTSVTVDQFRQTYQNELQRAQQQARRPITNAEAHQLGLDSQVLSRLVSEAIIDHQAESMGLAISQEQIAKAVIDDPAFKGPDGKFDRGRFNELLRENGLSERNFLRDQRNIYLRQELVQGIAGGVQAPRAALDALHRFQAETRSVDYLVLPPAAAGTIPAPDEAALKKFFDDRAGAFHAPEYRKLVILPLLPATLAKPEQVSDADVAKLYDEVKNQRFTTPEYRTLQQIVFPNEADAQAAANRITSGTSFAAIATERKLGDKDVELGRVTKASLFDKAVADAAFALPQGGVSAPIKTPFGAVLVRAAAIDPAATQPLAEVAPALRQELATSRTGNLIRDLHDKVEDARASGQSLTDAAKAAGQQARVIDAVDASGKDKSGQPVADLPDAAALLKAAFASDIGVDNDTVRTPDGGQIFYEVASIEPARAQKLEEVKAKVEDAWRQDEVAKRLSDKATALVKSIKDGQSLAEAAASVADVPAGSVAVQHVADVRRTGGTGLDAATVAQVFDGPVGTVGTAPGQGGTRVVFKVLGSVVPPYDAEDGSAKQLAEQYRGWIGDDMVTAYLNDLQGRIGVKINPQAYQAAIGSNG